MDLIESLESRRLLSASLPYIVGQYTGSATVAFTPASGHPPSADSVTLAIGSESARGKLAGTIGDNFGQPVAIAGRLTAKGVARLRIVTDRRGSDESGKLVLTFDQSNATLTGSYRETDRAAHLHWAGSLTLQAPPDDFVGTYTGTANGEYTPQNLGPQITQTPYTAAATLTISTESADGAVTGSISGFGVAPIGGQPFASTVTGTVAGNVISLNGLSSDAYQTGITATLTAGSEITGTFSTLPNDMESYIGTFSVAVGTG